MIIENYSRIGFLVGQAGAGGLKPLRRNRLSLPHYGFRLWGRSGAAYIFDIREVIRVPKIAKCFMVDPDVYEKLSVKCRQHDIPVSTVIRRMMWEAVNGKSEYIKKELFEKIFI